MAVKTRMTLADFEALPDDGKLYELVEGEVRELTFPVRKHGRVQQKLSLALGKYLENHRVGEAGSQVGFLLSQDPDTLRSPDVYFVVSERAGQTDPDAWFEGAPDLAVEIVSPSNRARDLLHKVRQFLAAGCHLVWVVYPDEREVHVFAADGSVRILRESDALEAPELLPGFSVPVAAIFES